MKPEQKDIRAQVLAIIMDIHIEKGIASTIKVLEQEGKLNFKDKQERDEISAKIIDEIMKNPIRFGKVSKGGKKS